MYRDFVQPAGVLNANPDMRLLLSSFAFALVLGGCGLVGNDSTELTDRKAVVESLGSIYIIRLEDEDQTEYFTYTLPKAYQQDGLRVVVSGEVIPTKTDLPLDKVRKTLKITHVERANERT